jgi:5'-nucleotidase
MRILLTNDDGINSPGILKLADALRKAGHRVFVVAPAADHSGVSHCITFLNGPRKLTAVGEDTWSCDGTPVDCVIIGLFGGLPELCSSLRITPRDWVLPG